MQRCPLDKPQTTNPKHIEEALDRMMDPTNLPTLGAPKPSKFNPKSWPTPVKTIAIAAITAGLVAAKVPAAIVSAITAWLFGG